MDFKKLILIFEKCTKSITITFYGKAGCPFTFMGLDKFQVPIEIS